MERTAAQIDRRLLGHWRSDRRRTIADWKWPPRYSPKKRKFVENLFGHLKLRYTRKCIYADLKGFRQRTKYEVLASDDYSVAIRTLDPLMILHINFEDGGYWISLGRQREWFKRPRAARRKSLLRHAKR